jgi:hypothetical protein
MLRRDAVLVSLDLQVDSDKRKLDISTTQVLLENLDTFKQAMSTTIHQGSTVCGNE